MSLRPEIKYVSIHVPKTGGTSFRHALQYNYDISTYYYHYDFVEGSKILHGHIQASKAREDFPDAKIFAMMRHPYTQIASNYAHYKAHPETRFEPGIGELPTSMSLTDFIMYEPMRNYQSKFLDEPIDYIGHLEKLRESLNGIDRLGVSIDWMGHHNAGDRSYALTEEQKDLVDEYHLIDMELYHGTLRSKGSNDWNL